MSRRTRAGAGNVGLPTQDAERSGEQVPRGRLAATQAARWGLSLVAAAGLGVDAYVHWELAPRFDTLTGAASPHISQGQLFRVEAGLAITAMVLVLVLNRSRLGALVAFLVAGGGLAAVLLYAVVDVGGVGPLPDMYDPAWYAEKTASAVAEAIAAVAALCLLLVPWGRRGRRS